MEDAVKRDIARAVAIARTGRPDWDPGEIIIQPSAVKAIKWLWRARIAQQPLACDIETDGGPIMAAPVTFISFSNGESSISIQLQRPGGQRYYRPKDDDRVCRQIRNLLGDPAVEKWGQNFIPFDTLVLNLRGFGPVRNVTRDSMGMHHTVRSEEPDGLEYLGSFYTNGPPWKGLHGEAKGKGWGFGVPESQMALYNAIDSLMTWHSCIGIQKEIDDLGPKTQRLVDQTMQLFRVARAMRKRGLLIDKKERRRYKKKLHYEMLDHHQTMNRIAGRKIKPGSLDQLRRLLFDEFQCRLIGKTATGRRRLTADDLATIALETDGKPRRFIQALTKWRTAQKLLGTYVKNLPIWEDGRVHASWNVTGALSGRWSSSETNEENQPEEMRTMYVAAPGHTFVLADYEAIEARCNAILAGDRPMLEAFENGVDVHTVNASVLFECPREKVTPKQRYFAKRFLYALAYGAGAVTIWSKLLPEYPDLKLRHIRKLLRAWWKAHPDWLHWREDLYDTAARLGYYESPLSGRRRTFKKDVAPGSPPKSTEVFNAPAQFLAADIINSATIRVFRRVLREGLGGGMGLQVHDSLGWEAPIANAKRVGAIMKEEMERPIRIETAPTKKVWVFPVKVEQRRRWAPKCVECKIEWGGEKGPNGPTCKGCLAPGRKAA